MQQLIVGVIVAAAFWVVLRRYAPKILRQAVRRHAVRLARAAGWNAVAERLDTAPVESGSCADGCGSCGGCGPAPAKPVPAAAVISVEALRRTTMY